MNRDYRTESFSGENIFQSKWTTDEELLQHLRKTANANPHAIPRPGVENIASIDQWRSETFPNVTKWGAFRKLAEEFLELAWALIRGDTRKAAVEAADVLICAVQMAGVLGADPQAVIDAKMAKNRSRQWNIRSDGTGQHVETKDV